MAPRGEVAAGGSLCAQWRGVSRDYFPGAERAHCVPRCCSSTGYRVAAGHPPSTAGRDRWGHPQADLLRAGHNEYNIRSSMAFCSANPQAWRTLPSVPTRGCASPLQNLFLPSILSLPTCSLQPLPLVTPSASSSRMGLLSVAHSQDPCLALGSPMCLSDTKQQ